MKTLITAILFLTIYSFPNLYCQDTLVQLDAEWHYNDTATALDSEDWTSLGYDDSSWKTGIGKFGFGDGNEVTTLEVGEDDNDVTPTFYFRHHFTIDDITEINQIIFNIIRDDGVIVYLNGNEIIRDNMPVGDIDYNTYASSIIAGSNESVNHEFILDNTLKTGENILAVEVHQSVYYSSDLGFSLSLTSLNHTTSTNELAETHQVSTFPNPTSDKVYVKINSLGKKSSTFSIFDLKGRVLLNQEVQLNSGSNLVSIDLKNMDIPQSQLLGLTVIIDGKRHTEKIHFIK